MAYAVEVVICNQFGAAMETIRPEIESVSWRLDGVGAATFSLPWTDAKCTRQNLALGNRVVIQWDNGLPTWGGVIDMPRSRRQGQTTVTAYTGERLLDWRVTDLAREYDEVPPGEIAQLRLEYENAQWPTGILVGTIQAEGTARTVEDHYHDLLRRMLDLVRLSGQDFDVQPLYANGTLTFVLNWWHQRGSDLRNSVWLVDGINARVAAVDEQGPLQNVIRLAGEGSLWTDDDRLHTTADDDESVQEYGYREYAEIQSTVSMLTTLEANAAALLAGWKSPQNRITVEALNELPAPFDRYDVGDRVTVEAYRDSVEWYLKAGVRILAREWRPDDVCRLEVEEVA